MRTVGLMLIGLLVATSAGSQDHRHGVQEFTESGTWRVPDGVSEITVELWGAGGGGGGGASGLVGGGPGGGGGGGSGAYIRARLAVIPAETYAIRIGAGGGGGGASRHDAQPGGNGDDTTLVVDGKRLLAAPGGRGGGAPGGARGGIGGSGGINRTWSRTNDAGWQSWRARA
jgi:hypothetical protein